MTVDKGGKATEFGVGCHHCRCDVLNLVPEIGEAEEAALRAHLLVCQGSAAGEMALGDLLRHFTVHVAN